MILKLKTAPKTSTKPCAWRVSMFVEAWGEKTKPWRLLHKGRNMKDHALSKRIVGKNIPSC